MSCGSRWMIIRDRKAPLPPSPVPGMLPRIALGRGQQDKGIAGALQEVPGSKLLLAVAYPMFAKIGMATAGVSSASASPPSSSASRPPSSAISATKADPSRQATRRQSKKRADPTESGYEEEKEKWSYVRSQGGEAVIGSEGDQEEPETTLVLTQSETGVMEQEDLCICSNLGQERLSDCRPGVPSKSRITVCSKGLPWLPRQGLGKKASQSTRPGRHGRGMWRIRRGTTCMVSKKEYGNGLLNDAGYLRRL